jgi:DNA-binding transcriptional ArsR family regulator
MSYYLVMRPDAWMDDLLGNRSKIRVLRLLVGDPARVWTEREIARALRASPNSVNLAARALRDQGILDFRRIGRSHAIRIRSELGVAKRVEQLFVQESQGWEDFKHAVTGAVPAGTACYLFGSVARGESSASSDVDLLVVAGTRREAEDVVADDPELRDHADRGLRDGLRARWRGKLGLASVG